MIAKLCMVLIFIGVAVGVGIYCRRSTASVDGFVLGGRSVGPWMSAFAFGTSYFSAVVFVGSNSCFRFDVCSKRFPDSGFFWSSFRDGSFSSFRQFRRS